MVLCPAKLLRLLRGAVRACGALDGSYLFWLTLAAAPAAHTEKRMALLIGNQSYTERDGPARQGGAGHHVGGGRVTGQSVDKSG